MRRRVGNPSAEAHGRAMRVYDWVAPQGTDPHDACLKAETALGVSLRGDGGSAHGYVTTSRRPDGSLYIAIYLYDAPCSDAACSAGHGPVRLEVAPDVTTHLNRCKALVGEHASYRLGGASDDAVLAGIGFRPSDPPMRR